MHIKPTTKKKASGSKKVSPPEVTGCDECPQRPAGVEGLLRLVEARLQADGKATVTDYIRLLELAKTQGVKQAKEIKVSWVEPTPES
jgi:hypothetical protein